MAFKLFKSGDELYENSRELIQRGDFEKARDYLVKSIEKEGGIDDVAAVQVALIDLRKRLNNAGAYQNLLNALDKLKSTDTIEFGLETLDAETLRTECELTSRKLQLLATSPQGAALKEKGQSLMDLAKDFQTRIGASSLVIQGLFKKDTSVTGNTEFYNLMALGYESLSDAVMYDDPSQAAEYQQIAAGYRQQNGQSAEENLLKVKQYSSTCTCWLCGRIANGEGIHFFSAPAEVPPSIKDGSGTAAKSRDGTQHIYICRACYTAVSNRSDEIANAYYQQARKDMAAMEARLQAQIASLQSQIAFTRMGR